MDYKGLINSERHSEPINKSGIQATNEEKGKEDLKRVMSIGQPDPLFMQMEEQKRREEQLKKSRQEDQIKDNASEMSEVSQRSFLKGVEKENNKYLVNQGVNMFGKAGREEEMDLDDVKDLSDLEDLLNRSQTSSQNRMKRYVDYPQNIRKEALKAGNLLSGSSRLVKKGKFDQEAIATGKEFIRKVNEWAGIRENSKGDEGKFYKEMGVKDTLDCLYVDGVPLRQFVSKQYGYKGSDDKGVERGILSAYAAMIAARQNHPITLVRPTLIDGVANVDIRHLEIDIASGKKSREAHIKQNANLLNGMQYEEYCKSVYEKQLLAKAGTAIRKVKNVEIPALTKMNELRDALYSAGRGKHKNYDDFCMAFGKYFDMIQGIGLDPDNLEVSGTQLQHLYSLLETAKGCAHAYLKGKNMRLPRHRAVKNIYSMLSEQSGIFWGVLRGHSLDKEGETISLRDLLNRRDEGFVVLGLEEEVDVLRYRQEQNAADKNEYNAVEEDMKVDGQTQKIMRMKRTVLLDPMAKAAFQQVESAHEAKQLDDEDRLRMAEDFLRAAAGAFLTSGRYTTQIREKHSDVLHDNEKLLYRIASKHVAASFREEFKTMPELQIALDQWTARQMVEEAKEESYKTNSVGKNISVKEFKENGGSSSHRYVTAQEKDEIIKASGGFLCARKINDKFYEIRPTLPEHALVLNGEKINQKDANERVELRKCIKAFFKTMAYLFFNEDGSLKQDLGKWEFEEAGISDTMAGRIDTVLRVGGQNREKNDAESFLTDFITPMTQMLTKEYKKKGLKDKAAAKKAEEDAQSYCIDFNKLIRNKYIGFISGGEVSLETFLIRNKVINEMTVDELMQEDSLKDLKIDGQPVTKEEVEEALAEAKKQAGQAVEDFKGILDMDIDDEEMFVINSCADNATFMTEIKQSFIDNKPKEIYEYKYETLAKKDPRKCIKIIRDNWDRFCVTASLDEKRKEEYLAQLEEAEEKLNNGQKLDKKDINNLKDMLTYNFSKYEKHSAPKIAQVGNDTYTIETFAGDSTTVITSPFSMNCRIGVYNSQKGVDGENHTGFNDYMVHDDPFVHVASRKNVIMSLLKNIISDRTKNLSDQEGSLSERKYKKK